MGVRVTNAELLARIEALEAQTALLTQGERRIIEGDWQGAAADVIALEGGDTTLDVYPLPPAPRPSTALVRAIDVSNYQPADLTALIRQAQATHVVVRLPVPQEPASFADIARAQLASASANGCTTSGYFWPYADNDPAGSVDFALGAARGIPLAVLWVDVERSSYEPVNLDWLGAAFAACDARSQRCGVYTSKSQWAALYGADTPYGPIGSRPLWFARYDGAADLVTGFEPFGGWTAPSGKQFTSSPVDTSLFFAEVTR